MRTLRDNIAISVSPGFYILMALLLLMLPIEWCLAAGAAAFFHEICHLTALRLCGGILIRTRIDDRGANMDASPLPPGKAFLCALAGPAGSFFLLLFSSRIPRIAICAAMQGVYNLLPLTTLDGGQALQALLSLFLPPEVTERLCKAVEKGCLAVLVMLGLYGTLIRKLGLLPLLFSLVLCMKASDRKIPCKSPKLRVQ